MSEQTQFSDVFGDSQVGGSDYLKAEKIAKGLTIARVLPSLKSQKANPKGWSMYHAVHYGYYGSNKKDANGKPWAKPFLCIQEKDFRTGMITVECPKCTQVKAQETAQKEREGEIRSNLKGRPEEAIKSALKADPTFQTFAKWLKQYNVDRHHYVNMKLETGDVKCIKIPGKCHKALKAEIEKLKAKKINAFDPNSGVFFAFERIGENVDTEYKVNPAKEEITTEHGTFERNKMAPLAPAEIPGIIAKAMDLPTAHGATVLSAEQIQSLVDCDEDPSTVDSIFDAAQPVVQQQAAKTVAAPKAAVKPAPAPEPEVVEESAAVEDDEEAQLLAKLAEARAKKAAAAKPAVKAVASAAKPAPKPAPAPVAIDEMDPDSFIAEFGDPSK